MECNNNISEEKVIWDKMSDITSQIETSRNNTGEVKPELYTLLQKCVAEYKKIINIK